MRARRFSWGEKRCDEFVWLEGQQIAGLLTHADIANWGLDSFDHLDQGSVAALAHGRDAAADMHQISFAVALRQQTLFQFLQGAAKKSDCGQPDALCAAQ